MLKWQKMKSKIVQISTVILGIIMFGLIFYFNWFVLANIWKYIIDIIF
mgnify:FL=1